jgi:hypothetical protein
MRNRFYPTLSAFHEDPPPPAPMATFTQKHMLVWVGGPDSSSDSVVNATRNYSASPFDVIQAGRQQILAFAILGGVAGYMIGKRRR